MFRRSGQSWLTGLLLAALFVTLRLPSLLEPTWYSDEGTYADIGRALLHGAVLYRDVWDNKPPGIYWLYAGIISVAGPGRPAFPVALALLVGAAAVAVWRLGLRFGGSGVATLATLIVIVFMSVPNLEGDLLNAEIVAAVLVAWAVVVLTGEGAQRWRAAAAGVLLGMALAFKAVFVVDVAAVLAIPLWMARSRGTSWRRAVPTMAMVAGAAAGVVLLVVSVVAVTASLGGLLDVLFRQDVSYLQLTTGPGGSVVRAASGTRLLSTVLLVVRIAVPVVGLGLLAWRLSVRGRRWGAILAWWLGCDLAGVMVSDRGFSHYAVQAEAVVALTAATLAVGAWRRRRWHRLAAVAVVLAAWPAIWLALFVPGAEVALAHGRLLPHLENGSFRTTQVLDYYRLSWEHVIGAASTRTYEAFFPTDMARQRAQLSRLFDRDSGPGQSVFVWGTIHWSYALSDRLPAGRYVSLNSAYAVDPGSQSRLLAELKARPPAVLIADIPLPPPVLDLMGALHYVRMAGAAAGDDEAWLAPWARR